MYVSDYLPYIRVWFRGDNYLNTIIYHKISEVDYNSTITDVAAIDMFSNLDERDLHIACYRVTYYRKDFYCGLANLMATLDYKLSLKLALTCLTNEVTNKLKYNWVKVFCE